MKWKFEWITDWDTVYSDSFQEKWMNWYNDAINHHIFFHPSLSMAWINTYRPIRQLSPLFCIARNEDTYVFFPLVLWKKNWKNAFQNLIVPVGYSDFDYHDALIIGDNNTLLDSFYNQLIIELKEKENFDKIEINGIRTVLDKENWSLENQISPYCELGKFSTLDEYLKSLKTKLRGDLNRQQRRMEEKGEVTLFVYDKNNRNKALEVLPEFISQHAKKWPNAYKAPDFHHNLLVEGLSNGSVDFTELRIENIPVSWHLGFKDKKRYYYYMPVINANYALLSPGKIHLLFLIERAIKLDLELFDHLRGDENYKAGWTNNIQKLYEFKLESTKPSSKIRNSVEDIKRHSKKWL